MKASLTHRPETRTVTDLINLHKTGMLNLNPGFQRQSVWNEKDRQKLIESILRNYPLPAVFFYRREHEGHIYYDVIDGKQRIESILMFTGEIKGRFALKGQLPDSDQVELIDWLKLKKKQQQHYINGYRLSVIEVDGDIGDIIDVFVRINSTGKALTSQEKKNAKYFNSNFLKAANKLANKFQKLLISMGVMSSTQVSRMKHVELMCELMLSAHQGDVINRKTALDRVMVSNSLTPALTSKLSAQVTTSLNRVHKMFPKLKTTRLRNLADFYSLAVLIGKFESEGLIMTNPRRNKLAWDLLEAFAVNVDKVRENRKKMIASQPDEEIYRDYLLTTSQSSDDVSQRRKRENHLRAILGSLFATKDSQRGFTAEQRRIIWSTSAERKCKGCSRKLSWDDFTIDHIDPYSKGGKSRLDNAALMCQSCNSSKGNR